MREQYSSYDECVSFFKKVESNNPAMFKVENIGKTHEEREMIAVTISRDVNTASERPALFFTGTIHAREWVGIELAIAFTKYLIRHYAYEPELRDIFDKVTMYIVPCANPDGFEFSRNHFCFWRKNRRNNGDGTHGVDLNRNFSVGFKRNKLTSSNVYSGPHAFSEPETQNLKAFAEAHSNIVIATDYHSQGNVFFPAHNFLHEDALDATDLNVLAANMAENARKVSGIEYGNHMGKPPASCISGSGREFYYSLGALATVVEVGTRNISDYEENMTLCLEEQIEALKYALSEVPNYDKSNSLQRVESFIAKTITNNSVRLEWSYETRDNINFEIYRSLKHKGYCRPENMIGQTNDCKYIDTPLKESTRYWYFIRAVDTVKKIKSAFAPVVELKTLPNRESFSKVLYPLQNEIGYVAENSGKNKEHFGTVPMYVGVSQKIGVCYGVCGFSLSTIPEDAIITDAKISFYPMDRVQVQVERYGEWRVGIMESSSLDSVSCFKEIDEVNMLSFIDRPTHSYQMSQGVWRTYEFAENDREVLQAALKEKKVLFRMQGPKELPLDRKSQLMKWEIGYGKGSNGLTLRPMLEVSYTLKSSELNIESYKTFTLSENTKTDASLVVGMDKNEKENFGVMEFDVSNLPSPDETVFKNVYVELQASEVKYTKNSGLRIHVEMVRDAQLNNAEDMAQRKTVERIGYDVSAESFENENKQRFVFDRRSINELRSAIDSEKRLNFVMFSTVEKEFKHDQLVTFIGKNKEIAPRLVVEVIPRRHNGVEKVSDLKYTMSEGKIKLMWKNPADEAFKGVLVVKNPFHIPCSPYDGEKVYGGSDEYTEDVYGSAKVEKYFAVFTYDDVPNFSEAESLFYKPSDNGAS